MCEVLIQMFISFCRTLVEQLERVNISQMEAEAQIAFWINIYNSLVMHVRVNMN